MQTTAKKSSKFTKKLSDDLLEIYYFYISQTKSSLDKIFYKIVYHRISTCVIFLVNLDDFFVVIYINFHENSGLHLIHSLLS